MDALHVKNLRKVYPNDMVALDDVSFSVEAGDFFGLLGPNGAGKTTLISIATSLIQKTSGELKIFDHDINKEPSRAKAQIGVVPQEYNFSIFESPLQIVMQSAGYYGIPKKTARARAEKYLKQLQIWDKRHAPARHLSGGMKRRLMIARAMAHEPKMLILDEPTAGVDVQVRRIMWDFLSEINRQGTTIILTTHYLEEAENLCKHIGIINRGKLIENAPTQQLLKKLQHETVVVYLEVGMAETPQLEGLNARLTDTTTLEIDLTPGKNFSHAVELLNKKNILIRGMKNKTGRLEQLFLNIVENDND